MHAVLNYIAKYSSQSGKKNQSNIIRLSSFSRTMGKEWEILLPETASLKLTYAISILKSHGTIPSEVPIDYE